MCFFYDEAEMKIYYQCPTPLHKISGSGIQEEFFLIFLCQNCTLVVEVSSYVIQFYDNIYCSSLRNFSYYNHFFG